MSEQKNTSSDNKTFILLLGFFLLWLFMQYGDHKPEITSVIAQPQPQPLTFQSAPVQPAPQDPCIDAIHSVPPGWEEGIGGPEPACWLSWTEKQRIEFLNYVRQHAAK